jgi:hypothetical protein
MNMHFEKTVRQLTRIARGVPFSAHKDNDRLASASTSRLPPTRAARAPRSRGIFFGRGGSTGPKKHHVVRASLTALMLGVCGILLAVFASRSISGVTLNANPGPGIVASASVAPAFMTPLKRR